MNRLPIAKEYRKIIVLDDRTDLWDEIGLQLNYIKPYHGELVDKELHRWKISEIKKQPKLLSLEEILLRRNGNL